MAIDKSPADPLLSEPRKSRPTRSLFRSSVKVRPHNAPHQIEFDWDKVSVACNDYSDSDFEVVPLRKKEHLPVSLDKTVVLGQATPPPSGWSWWTKRFFRH